MGSRIIKMDPAQGFAAQGGGAAVMLTAVALGFPLSTTHSITGAVMGAGAAKRLSRGALGRGRATSSSAWVLTLPAAAVVGALTYGVSRIFGTGAVGPLVVSVALLGADGRGLRQAPAARPGPHDLPGRRVIAAIDTKALLELVWAAPLAVLVVTVAWGMVVHGATRAADARRDGRVVLAGAHAAIAGLGAGCCSSPRSCWGSS